MTKSRYKESPLYDAIRNTGSDKFIGVLDNLLKESDDKTNLLKSHVAEDEPALRKIFAIVSEDYIFELIEILKKHFTDRELINLFGETLLFSDKYTEYLPTAWDKKLQENAWDKKLQEKIFSRIEKITDANDFVNKVEEVLNPESILGNLMLFDRQRSINKNKFIIPRFNQKCLDLLSNYLTVLHPSIENYESRMQMGLNTLLLFAAVNNDIEGVKHALYNGADINYQDELYFAAGYNALHAASARGHYDIVKLLLAYSPNHLKLTNNGLTAQQLAENNHHLKVARLLQQRGTEVKSDSLLPLRTAAISGNIYDIFRVLKKEKDPGKIIREPIDGLKHLGELIASHHKADLLIDYINGLKALGVNNADIITSLPQSANDPTIPGNKIEKKYYSKKFKEVIYERIKNITDPVLRAQTIREAMTRSDPLGHIFFQQRGHYKSVEVRGMLDQLGTLYESTLNNNEEIPDDMKREGLLFLNNIRLNNITFVESGILTRTIPKEAATYLKNGASINFRNSNNSGRTALHLALIRQDYFVAKWLLENGADPEIKDDSGKDAFAYLPKTFDDLRKVHLAQKAVQKISPKTLGTCTNQVITEKLIEDMGDINQKDAEGFTALDYALAYFNSETVRLLLKNGASFKECKESLADYFKYVIVDHSENQDMISILVEQAQKLNIDLTAIKIHNKPIGSYLLSYSHIKHSLLLIDTLQKYNVPDKKIIESFGNQLTSGIMDKLFVGYNPKALILEEYLSDKNIVKSLKDCEDLLNRNNPKGHLLFIPEGFYECRETKGSLGKVLKHYEQMLNKNPSIRERDAKLAYVRNIKAWNAAYEGNLKELQKLKNAGADLNFINTNHPDAPTPLSIAIKRNNGNTVKWLIENGAHPTKSMQSLSASSGLIARGTYKGIQSLLADYQKTKSPLHTQFLHAVKNGNVEGVREALGRGAHIDAQIGENDESALLVAIDAGQHHLVSVLIAAGAEVAFSDKHGMNSLHSAIIQGNLPLIRQLLGSVNNSTQLQKLLTANYVDEAANIYERFLTYGDEVNDRLLTLYDVKDPKRFRLTPLSLAEVIGDSAIVDTIRAALAREKLEVPPRTAETPAASIPTMAPYEPVPYPDPFNFQQATPSIYPALPKATLTNKLATAKKATLNGDIKLLTSILNTHPAVANELFADENNSLWKDAFVKFKPTSFPELINVLCKHGMQETKIISLLPKKLDDHVKHQKRAIIRYLRGIKDPQTRANEMRLALDSHTGFGYTIFLGNKDRRTPEFTELADEYEKLIRENFQLANREEALEFINTLENPLIDINLRKLRQTLQECAPEKRAELAQSLLYDKTINSHLMVRELLKHGANFDRNHKSLTLQRAIEAGHLERIDMFLSLSPDPSAEPALFQPKYYDSDNNNISSLARVTFRQPITKLFAFINLLRFHNIAESKIIQLLPNNPSFIFKSTYKDEILARLRAIGNLETQIEEYEGHLGLNGETVEHAVLAKSRGAYECTEATGTLGKALDDYEKLLDAHPELPDRDDKLKRVYSIRLNNAVKFEKSVKILEGLIKKGADINYKNPYGYGANTTTMAIASKIGHNKAVKFFQDLVQLNLKLINDIGNRKTDIQYHIKAGADINGIIHTNKGELVTPIMSAIFTNNLNTLKKVHHAGANLWSKNDATPPLVCAIIVNSKEIFNYLLDHAKDKTHKTTLLNNKYKISKIQLQQSLHHLVHASTESTAKENINQFIVANDKETYDLTLLEIANLFGATEIATLLRPAALSPSPQPSAPPIEELVSDDSKENKHPVSTPAFFATSKIDSKKDVEQYINQATQAHLDELQEKTVEVSPASKLDTTGINHAKDDLLAELDIMSDDAKASRWYSIPTEANSQLPPPLQPQNIANPPPPKYSEHPTVSTQFTTKAESDTKENNKENKTQKNVRSHKLVFDTQPIS